MTDTTSSAFELSFTNSQGETVPLATFEGRPLLVVNTASQCGFTPQYEGLQALHEAYADQGLVVIGFPCDQFAHQEPGNDAEIEEFCRINYGVEFPLSTKVDVNGKDADPVFAFLKERAGGRLGSAIKWNFTKFLVAPEGRPSSATARRPALTPSARTSRPCSADGVDGYGSGRMSRCEPRLWFGVRNRSLLPSMSTRPIGRSSVPSSTLVNAMPEPSASTCGCVAPLLSSV